MKALLKIIAGALTTILSISPNFMDFSDNPAILMTTAPINNGVLMLYTPNADLTVDKIPITIDDEAETVDSANSADLYEPETDLPDTLDLPEKQQQEQQEDLPVFSRNISTLREDMSEFSSRDATVIQRTFRPEFGENYIQLSGGGQVRNTTEINDERLIAESLLLPEFVPEKNGEPQVLIIHTHTTESFRLSNDSYYDFAYNFRTLDSRNNIVAVGAKIAEEIAKEGFAVLHDGTLHDYPVYSGSYRRSAETVKAVLEEYPSIKIVLDIHRDAIEDENERSVTVPVAAVFNTNNRETAQIMIISPADTTDGEWGIPDFMQNFRLASRLQSRLESDNPGITRALLFQYCNYNLHLSTGALLIEIGSHGNSLEQALNAGELFGQSMARLLSELSDRD
ncbi:MAG: stage II sporulation protein P [Oscillospiraceae bacterium]|nr:stage II sporulation protein P [Oscillospiraceae bacterium]